MNSSTDIDTSVTPSDVTNRLQDLQLVETDARPLRKDHDVKSLHKQARAYLNEDCYRMDRFYRGKALIINNEKYYESSEMSRRFGSDIDAINLKEIFQALGFDVTFYEDLTSHLMKKVFKKMSTFSHYEHDCFACAILAHGDDDGIYGVDGELVKMKEIIDCFRGDACPSLAGKPKIFILQACRGSEYEIPVFPSGDVVDGPSCHDVTSNHVITMGKAPVPNLPSGSDFLLCYSVAEGFYSFRDSKDGSWFIQEFTAVVKEKLLSKPECDATKTDFLEILTTVNKRVSARSVDKPSRKEARGKKQMPCFMSMLTKKLYLQRKRKQLVTTI